MVEPKSCKRLRRNFVKALAAQRKAERRTKMASDKIDKLTCD